MKIPGLATANHSLEDRANNDFYATSPEAINILLTHISLKNRVIWECAAGQGHLIKGLLDAGVHPESIQATDLYIYQNKIIDFPITKLDFLKFHLCDSCDRRDSYLMLDGKDIDVILTNPPYKYSYEFIYRAIKLLYPQSLICFFLPIRYLEGIKRKKLFEQYPPEFVIISSKRIICANNGDFEKSKGNNAQAYAWYVWRVGYKGETIIKWA